MPYNQNSAQCPCCGIIAHGQDEITRIFGYRNMGDGRIIPQSYCRRCRTAKCSPGSPKH